MTVRVLPTGPQNAKIMIVGEAPGRSEVLAGEPFVGASGKELDKMLHEAGILRTECFITNVCKEQPPNNDIKKFFIKHNKTARVPGPKIEEGLRELQDEINRVQPNVIIALGDTALWALTGETGITKWRGSLLKLRGETGEDNLIPDVPFECKVIPTYHPAAILRMWSWRFIAVQDLRRANAQSHYPELRLRETSYIIRPVFELVMATLQGLLKKANDAATQSVSGGFAPGQYPPTGSDSRAVMASYAVTKRSPGLLLAGDIETRAGHIACFGIAWDDSHAMCIPFMSLENDEGYWTEAEEAAIILKLKELFQHPNIGWAFQNGLFDLQYFAAHWGFIPHVVMDTMLAHHTCFPGLPKSLDFLSSMYCEQHKYWKDDGKLWDPKMGEEQLWSYNCEDCVRTYEITAVLITTVQQLEQEEQFAFQMEQFMPVLRMMLRGVRIDKAKKAQLSLELMEAIGQREKWLEDVISRPINIKSPKQMQEFFYGELGLPVQKVRKTGRPTTNDEALQNLAKKEPLIKPITDVVAELRSLNVFLSTFVKARLSSDGRMRCSYNIAGTETFRWSSSKDAFGSGLNLQNIPKGTEEKD